VTWSNSLSLAETLAAQIGIVLFGFGIERLPSARSIFSWPGANHALNQ
jgi:hypothetical protein